METSGTAVHHAPWNKGKIVGQKVNDPAAMVLAAFIAAWAFVRASLKRPAASAATRAARSGASYQRRMGNLRGVLPMPRTAVRPAAANSSWSSNCFRVMWKRPPRSM
mgnify:CR=1 FL=1